MGEIGKHVMQNLVQISKLDKRYESMARQVLGEEDGAKVIDVLRMPVQSIEDKFGVNVTATSSQTNKEVEKQTFATLAQMAAQFYPQMVQYAQLLGQSGGDPSLVPETAQAAYRGQAELLKRLLEVYDIQNPEAYLPPQAEQQSVGGGVAGGAAAVVNDLARMALGEGPDAAAPALGRSAVRGCSTVGLPEAAPRDDRSS